MKIPAIHLQETVIEDGLRAYARMLNRLDPNELEPWLADTFTYESQMVITPISPKSAFLEYIHRKMSAIRDSDLPVWAEMGWLNHSIPGPCVVVAQGEKENLVGLIVATAEAGKLVRLDMCIAPPPHSANRSGIYPGLD